MRITEIESDESLLFENFSNYIPNGKSAAIKTDQANLGSIIKWYNLTLA